MPRKTHDASAQFTRHLVDIAMAAPQVIASRTAQMAFAGAAPSAADQREFQRMHEEKLGAFQEGWTAMVAETMRLQQGAALAMMGGWWLPAAQLPSAESLSRDAFAILAKGIAPMRHAAVANAKRLGAKRG